MPCLGLKISAGAQTAGLLLTGTAAVRGAPTVVISAAALAAMYVQLAGLSATLILLATCLDQADRHADADSLRRDVDELKREMELLPH